MIRTVYYSLKCIIKLKRNKLYYFLFSVKTKNTNNRDIEKFNYHIIKWCSYNLKQDFRPGINGQNLMIITSNKSDGEFLKKYWTKDIIKKDVYRLRNLKT